MRQRAGPVRSANNTRDASERRNAQSPLVFLPHRLWVQQEDVEPEAAADAARGEAGPAAPRQPPPPNSPDTHLKRLMTGRVPHGSLTKSQGPVPCPALGILRRMLCPSMSGCNAAPYARRENQRDADRQSGSQAGRQREGEKEFPTFQHVCWCQHPSLTLKMQLLETLTLLYPIRADSQRIAGFDAGAPVGFHLVAEPHGALVLLWVRSQVR